VNLNLKLGYKFFSKSSTSTFTSRHALGDERLHSVSKDVRRVGDSSRMSGWFFVFLSNKE